MNSFTVEEYHARITQTKLRMQEQGMDVLLITDPANMNYLSGYDGWSFYVDQMLMIFTDRVQPIWIGRKMDANAAKVTTWLNEENILYYPEDHIHSQEKHPMDFIARVLQDIGVASRRIGLEMASYYFSALAYEKLKVNLPNAKFINASLLVNKVRIIKSDQEIEYIRRAAIIAGIGMNTAIASIQEGVRECDVAANIFRDLVSGTESFGGDYPSIVPLLPAGKNTSTPHLTWTDRQYTNDEVVIIELAGCHRRYHAPMARTLSLGRPSEEVLETSKILVEGLNVAIEAVKPGATCEEVEMAWRSVISKYGIEKDSRMGYSVGIGYPPDWGEHTASIRSGDLTILQPNMTFHMIPGLWFDDFGVEISETIRVTESGCEVLTDFQRELIIKDQIEIAM
ncbi:M24 family metallopeptidase [Sporosarcina sp. Sa2YVA2]|uniref:M24 family metallopeptidase n=1 Tax=Sporosarcina quadrami TaxID=2762234 RepID=A0ABR8UBD8_9BACL|nr:M24 family metallopeptidase [Sporosarcina quadrami]MBD7985039.1 M24 family metallopeptidase [Sporosarcina quadrami]